MRTRLAVALVTALAACFLGAAPAAQASTAPTSGKNTEAGSASTPGIFCRSSNTPYHWLQESCLQWLPDAGMEGTGTFYLQTGFNRANVLKCTAYAQLVSGYGTSTTHSESCTGRAKLGGYFTMADDWGFGRRSGDTYRQYTWLVVQSTSGVTYNSRPYAARTDITVP